MFTGLVMTAMVDALFWDSSTDVENDDLKEMPRQNQEKLLSLFENMVLFDAEKVMVAAIASIIEAMQD